MANIDRPNGFKFAKSLLGMAPNAMIRKYTAADRSGDATGNHGDIYIGDPVKLVSGKVLPANSNDTILGVCVAIGKSSAIEHGDGYFNADDLSLRYAPLADATGLIIAVMPAEGNIFEIQTAADLDLVAGSAADINLIANTAHGSRTSGNSTTELVADSNHDITVIEDVTTPGMDTTLVNARHLVKFTDTVNTM